MFFLRSIISLVHLSRIQVLFSFEVPSGMTSYTFMLSLPEGGSVRICQYDKRNKLKAEFTSNEPFFTVDVAKKVTRWS